MKSYYYGLILNLQFFTTIPIPVEVPVTDKNIERSIRLFPLLGLFLGIVYSLLAYVFQVYSPFSNLLISFLIWFLTIVLTGGLHIDGWMDSADAFFSYQEKIKRLEIMADPRMGAFGVIAGVVLLLAKFLFIYELLINTNSYSYFYIALIPMLSRSLMSFIVLLIPNAKNEGLGYFFQKAQNNYTLFFYFIYLLLLSIPAILSGAFFINFSILLAVTISTFYFIKKKAIKWFGGMTGDLIGATTEGVEVLLWFTLLLLHYFGMV